MSDSEQKQKLNSFIEKLLIIQTIKGKIKKKGRIYLYETLFKEMEDSGGGPIASKDLPEQYKPKLITGQRSGTCTQKSLNQLIN